MRLRSIEICEVGTFSKAVRIDGIGPGLNVLAGANELGKSTVLRALTHLFLEGHRSAKQTIRELRPYRGGAPRIQCGFDLSGANWLLEKQFLTAQKARLERLDGGEAHQGADAENRLAALLADHGALQTVLPLLWVEQGASFNVPVLSDDMRHGFGQLLAAQAESASGLGAAQAVLRAVEAELGALVTKKTDRAKRGGLYDRLLTERADVSAALAAAVGKAEDAGRRLARLAELQDAERGFMDPEAAATLKAQITDREARLKVAQEARSRLQQINERIAFLESRTAQRAETLARFDDDVRESAMIAEAQAVAETELESIAARVGALDQTVQTAMSGLGDLEKSEASVRAGLDRARARSQRADRAQRLSELRGRRERLGLVTDEIAGIEQQLGALQWPDSALAELRTAASRRDQIEARLATGAPRLTIRYQAGRTEGIRIAGQPIGDGASLIASGPTVIEVAGVGQIEVMPAGHETLHGLADELVTVERTLAAGFAQLGVSSLVDAEARDGHRGQLRQRRSLLEAEAQAVAPQGAAQITSEIDALGPLLDEHASAGEATTHTAAEFTIELNTLLAEKEATGATLEAARSEKAKLEARRTGIATELRMRRTRCDELRAKFQEAGGAAELRVMLAAHVTAAEQELNEAARDRIALREVVLEDSEQARLLEALANQRRELQGRGERLGLVRQDMRLVEGQLARDFEEGPGERVQELQARLTDINRRLRETERRIAALRLLADELVGETSRRRDQISKPLGLRLERLAGSVWPAATLPLTSDLTVDGLVRNGIAETAQAVSAGTREQVAVLARLAYAGMIADGGEDVPLILDDPLVFSDDKRLGALFEVLTTAARAHQIILLSCHERAFEPLIADFGAQRLFVAEL